VHRNWENNQQLLNDGGNADYCTDIAKQLIYGNVGKKLKIIMGGGREEFLPKHEFDEEMKPGLRTDDLNLIKHWQHKHRQAKSTYAQNKVQLMEVSLQF
jgi:alkaline phosphatase